MSLSDVVPINPFRLHQPFAPAGDQPEAISKLAEGIEDRAAWDALQAMGCHEGKGYFISKPLERTALIAWIRAYTL